MKKLSLRLSCVALITALAFSTSSAAASQFTELPDPVWKIEVPQSTSIDYFYKEYYHLAKQYSPIISRQGDYHTAYSLLYRAASGEKSSYQVMAVDDATGQQKWIRSFPYSYNAFDIDLQGNLYYLEKVMLGKKMVDKLVALDSANQVRWTKQFDTSHNYSVLDDGRIAAINVSGNKNTLDLFSSEGKQLYSRSYDGIIRHIQGDYVGTVDYTKTVTRLNIFALSTNKKVVSVNLPFEYHNRVHADFDVLSGGTVLIAIMNANTATETLYGFSPDGTKKWSRVLPTPKENETDKLFMSVGNDYIVQDGHTLSVYDTNNRLLATKTFDELPGQATLQRLDSQTIVLGAVEDKGAWYDYEKPSKAVYYVLDTRTLNVKQELLLEEAAFSERNIRFTDAHTFYLNMFSSLAKYELSDN